MTEATLGEVAARYMRRLWIRKVESCSEPFEDCEREV